MLVDGATRPWGSWRRADGVGVSWDAYPVPSAAAVAAASVARHAIDAAPARRRGDVNSSPLDRARTAASSPRNDLEELSGAPDALVDFHIGTRLIEPTLIGFRRFETWGCLF